MLKLYKKSPLFIQNCIVTIKNNHTYFIKYRAIPFIKPLKIIIKKLDKDLWINDNNVEKRINNLINEAINNVPYYIENKHKYTRINSIDELRKLPILKKPIFKSRNKDFISKKSNYFNSYFFKTSGSTGTPIKGAFKNKDINIRFMTFLAALKTCNIDYSNKVARFLGSEVADENNIYRKDFINNHYLFSIYHISKKNIMKYFKAIEKNKIEIIEGYPSTIYSLVKLFKTYDFEISSVKNVLTTAEKLLDYQKEEIESYFNCKVFDFYGSSEGSAFMFLKGDKYINANKIGYVEVVDDEYKPVEKGVLGRMLITSFTSNFTPLIRYDIGDYCVLSDETIDDKYQIIVDEIVGRSEDVFITKEGVLFTRFSLCLKYLPDDIIESQLDLKQRSKNVTLKYRRISGKYDDLRVFKLFENKFESMLGGNYFFEYQFIEQFEKKSRGKLRAVNISE